MRVETRAVMEVNKAGKLVDTPSLNEVLRKSYEAVEGVKYRVTY